MELKLFVKIANGEEPMTLSVKPSYSIEMIKTQIQSLRDIPVKNQTLKLNGIELKNEDHLSQHQIENCIVWLSYKPKEISIHIFENWRTKTETIKFEVDWTETIFQMKVKILIRKTLPPLWQKIYLGNGVWNEGAKLKFSESLADDKIFKKAVEEGLSLMIPKEISIHIFENQRTKKETITFEVDWTETISQMTAKVFSKKRIPSLWQNMYLGYGVWNEKTKLEYHSDLLSAYDKKKVVEEGLSLMISGNIRIHNESNLPFSVEIEAFETITEVKRKIQVHHQFQEFVERKSKRSKFFESNTEPTLYKRDEYEILQKLEDDNNKTVYDYGIDDFIKGKFILTKTPDYVPKNYPIFVKISDKFSITIDCYHFDTISILKDRILENGRLQRHAGQVTIKQLIFSGQPLQELGRTLKDYKIGRESTLECICDDQWRSVLKKYPHLSRYFTQKNPTQQPNFLRSSEHGK